MNVIKQGFPIKTLYKPRQTPLERSEGYFWMVLAYGYSTVCCIPTNRIQMLCKLKSTCHIQLLHRSEHMPWASQAYLASNYFGDLAEKSSSGAFSHGLSDSTHCDTEQVKHQLRRSTLLIFLMITHHRQGAPGSSFLLWRETVHYSELVFHFGNP